MKSKTNTAPLEQRQRERFFAEFKRHLKGLYSFVRRQLAYFEALGDLVPGDLPPEAVIDTVFLQAYREFLKEPPEKDMAAWLKEIAAKYVESQVQRLKIERSRSVSLQQEIPLTASAEAVSTLGEEIYDFYQPGEDLKLEDIFPDVNVSTPEDWVAAQQELLRCVNSALGGMPKKWRRALRLSYTRGLTYPELAKVLDEEEPEVERVLEYTRQHLRQSLIESGCRFISKETETHSRRQ